MKIYTAIRYESGDVARVETFAKRSDAERQIKAWLGEIFIEYIEDFGYADREPNIVCKTELLEYLKNDIEHGELGIDDSGKLEYITIGVDPVIDCFIAETELK